MVVVVGGGGGVYYGGVGSEDEAGMSIDSGCMRLKPPSRRCSSASIPRYHCRPLLLETVNLQSCCNVVPPPAPLASVALFKTF